jgi:hypothetical protein
MVSHVVLIKPRPDLTADERREMVTALETAARSIPSIRGVHVGRRVKHGAGYEANQPDVADFLIVFDFADFDGLRSYLAHPAHAALGVMFYQSVSAACAYDFEQIGLEGLATFV